jgi:hypothetical protein
MSVNCIDLLRVYSFDTSKKIRLGVPSDGGYVIADLGAGAMEGVPGVAFMTVIFRPVSAMKRALRATFSPVIPRPVL